ncbi:hypothetical protein GCM10009856_29600 [Mycolicibacterium llatzerense]
MRGNVSEVVQISDRETTITKLVDALSAVKTGRRDETMGLPAPMRRAAAEGLADLGFRYIEALATQRIVMPEKSWLGSHAIPSVESIDPESRASMEAALEEWNPELAAAVRSAETAEQKAALLAQLQPEVAATLAKSMDMDAAASAIRAEGKAEAAALRERHDMTERGE